MKTVRLIISGRVQGVSYRVNARKTAIGYNLTGWVRNINNDVEAVVSGKGPEINDFIRWCHQGPERAIVKNVKVEEIPFQEFRGFIIKR